PYPGPVWQRIDAWTSQNGRRETRIGENAMRIAPITAAYNEEAVGQQQSISVIPRPSGNFVLAPINVLGTAAIVCFLSPHRKREWYYRALIRRSSARGYAGIERSRGKGAQCEVAQARVCHRFTRPD